MSPAGLLYHRALVLVYDTLAMEPHIQYAKTEDSVSIVFWTLGGMPLAHMAQARSRGDVAGERDGGGGQQLLEPQLAAGSGREE